MNGPSFWRSCNNSARYWLRHRNQIRPGHARKIKAQIRCRPKRLRTREDQSPVPPKKPTQSQNRDLPAHLRRPGGPNRRHGPSEGEAGVRTVHVVVHGGRVGWGRRLGAYREKRRWCVCFYRRVSFFFLSRCGGSSAPFGGNLGKTLRCARHLASQHLRHPACLPRRVYKPLPPRGNRRVHINLLCHIMPDTFTISVSSFPLIN
jgi:hypothetical protein